MSQQENNLRIDYIEIPAASLATSKKFYNDVFGWSFKDWGESYASFNDGRMRGALTTDFKPKPAGVLLILYSTDLESTQQRVVAAGGKLTKQTFEFPGGKRFHFTDPAGNELGVWSEA
jgi:predicted enzyme related to lactoylglutathione lyase